MSSRIRFVTKSLHLLVVVAILLTSLPMPAQAGVPPVRLSAPGTESDDQPGLRLYAIVDPPVVEAGAQAVCTVTVVNEDAEDLTGLTLSASLPGELFTLSQEHGSRRWSAAVANLARGQTAHVELPLDVSGSASGPLEFEIELRDADGQLRATTTAIVGVAQGGMDRPVAATGGHFASDDGRVRVEFPSGAVQTSLNITARMQVQQVAPHGRAERERSETVRRSGTLLRFTLDAQDTRTSEAVHQFERAVTLAVDLRGLIDEGGLPAGQHLYLIYLADPETGEWEEVESTFDPRTGLLSAQVDHFSDWEIGVVGEGWKPILTPPVPDLFSGAVTYHHPIQVPPGRNGLQPNVTISYNSRRVDGLIDGIGRSVDGGPVALGWSVGGVTEVVRRHKFKACGEHGCLHLYNDFSLVLNGVSHKLVPDVEGQVCGRYRARNAPGLYVERRNAACENGSSYNETTDYWIVRQADGTQLQLGYTRNSEAVTGQANSALARCYGFCAPNGNPRFGAARSRVDSITDTMGNRMEFTYREKNIDPGPLASWTQRSMLLEIRYNSYDSGQWMSKVSFIPVSNDPDDEGYMRVKRVDVWNEDEKVRWYELTTDKKWWNACGQNHSERALLEIQEFSGDGTPLPPVGFGHEALKNFRGGTDGVGCFTFRRVRQVANGYGGRVEFSYENDGRCVDGNWPETLPDSVDPNFRPRRSYQDTFGIRDA